MVTATQVPMVVATEAAMEVATEVRPRCDTGATRARSHTYGVGSGWPIAKRQKSDVYRCSQTLLTQERRWKKAIGWGCTPRVA